MNVVHANSNQPTQAGNAQLSSCRHAYMHEEHWVKTTPQSKTAVLESICLLTSLMQSKHVSDHLKQLYKPVCNHSNALQVQKLPCSVMCLRAAAGVSCCVLACDSLIGVTAVPGKTAGAGLAATAWPGWVTGKGDRALVLPKGCSSTTWWHKRKPVLVHTQSTPSMLFIFSTNCVPCVPRE